MIAYRGQAQRQTVGEGSTRRQSRFWVALPVAAIALVCLIATAGDGYPARAALVAPVAARISDIPSHARTYRASLITSADPIELGRPLAVTLEIRTAANAPVEGALLTVESWMPDDETAGVARPWAIAELGGGLYRVDGIRFDSRGWWNVRLRISTTAATDSLAFNLVLR